MQALERLLKIIEAVAAVPTGLNPTEVAGRVELSVSTVARIMTQLSDEHVFDKSEISGRYKLGSRLVDIVQSATGNSDERGMARPLMQGLRDRSGETVSLHIRVGSQRVCIETVPSRHAVARLIPLGMAQPLIDSASGEILLAAVSETELNRLLDTIGVSERAVPKLKQRLSTIRANGWAIYQGKLVLGVTGVSAVVPNLGSEVGALSVSGPVERFTPDLVQQTLPDLVAVANQISQLMRLAG